MIVIGYHGILIGGPGLLVTAKVRTARPDYILSGIVCGIGNENTSFGHVLLDNAPVHHVLERCIGNIALAAGVDGIVSIEEVFGAALGRDRGILHHEGYPLVCQMTLERVGLVPSKCAYQHLVRGSRGTMGVNSFFTFENG